MKKTLRLLMLGVLLSPFATSIADEGQYLEMMPTEGDEAVLAIVPSACPDCRKDCVKPTMMWVKSQKIAFAAGAVEVNEDDPVGCFRFDGFHLAKDAGIELSLRNKTTGPFFIRVAESGQLRFERYVLPGESFQEELAPTGDRRYTVSVAADASNAKGLPANVGLRVDRAMDLKNMMMSLVEISVNPGE